MSITLPPLLLCHFDGSNGQTTTVDSSTAGHAVLLNHAALSTTKAKFGPSSLGITAFDPLATYAAAIPYTYGGPLDIFSSGKPWTIACFANTTYNAAAGFPFLAFAYGGSYGGGAYGGFLMSLADNNNGTVTAGVDGTQLFGGSVQTATVAQTTDGWHYLVAQWDGTNGIAYIDGVKLGTVIQNWSKAAYTTPTPAGPYAPAIIAGSNIQWSGLMTGGYVDELIVTTSVLPTTAPTSPFVSAPFGQGDITDPYAWASANGALPPEEYVSNSGGGNY